MFPCLGSSTRKWEISELEFIGLQKCGCCFVSYNTMQSSPLTRSNVNEGKETRNNNDKEKRNPELAGPCTLCFYRVPADLIHH